MVASVTLFLAVAGVLTVPLTHGVAGHRLHKDATNAWSFWRPPFFSGGPRFMTFQGFSWSFFAISAVCCLLGASMSSSDYVGKMGDALHVKPPALLGASACSALIAEVLMIASLFTYHRGVRGKPRHVRKPSVTSQALTQIGSYVTVTMCCTLALAGSVALLTTHHYYATPAARLLFAVIALACFAIAVPVTHGLGGRLKHSLTGTWTFYQPGRGGFRFMLLQGFGWACFAVSVAACAVLVMATLRAILVSTGGDGSGSLEMRSVAVASWVAGLTGLAAQIILACSLMHFQPHANAPASSTPLPASAPYDWRGFAQMILVLHVIHAPHLILLAIIATVFAASPNLSWSAATFTALGLAYSPTFLGAPGSTGLRSWTAFQAWATRVVEDVARRWHGKCRVIRDGEAWHLGGNGAGGNDAGGKLIFGYHPHGLYPAAACWFHLTPQFASLFPSVPSPVTLGASVIFRVPLLRDVAMWAGARNVSRDTFLTTLEERGAVVLCPGGQAELVEHVGGETDDTVTLCTRHKGFIRIAIEQRARLVPVFCFGESQALKNLWKWKAAQRWTYKRLGFPMPFLAVGFKGFLPLPAPLPLSFVVGEPIEVPPPGEDGRASDVQVSAVCAEYYGRIEDLFNRYKESSGFPHLRLVLKHD